MLVYVVTAKCQKAAESQNQQYKKNIKDGEQFCHGVRVFCFKGICLKAAWSSGIILVVPRSPTNIFFSMTTP